MTGDTTRDYREGVRQATDDTERDRVDRHDRLDRDRDGVISEGEGLNSGVAADSDGDITDSSGDVIGNVDDGPTYTFISARWPDAGIHPFPSIASMIAQLHRQALYSQGMRVDRDLMMAAAAALREMFDVPVIPLESLNLAADGVRPGTGAGTTPSYPADVVEEAAAAGVDPKYMQRPLPPKVRSEPSPMPEPNTAATPADRTTETYNEFNPSGYSDR